MPDNSANDTTQLLIQYMDNELSVLEKETVKKMLASDEKLFEQYQYLLAAKDAIRSKGLKQRVQTLQAEFLKERNKITIPAKIVRSSTVFKTFMRVAAIFLFAIAGFGVYEYASTTNQSVYNESFTSYQSPVNRSNENTNDLSRIYNAGKYTDVISRVNLKQQKNQQDYFLAAQSYLQLNQPAKAIENFKKVEDLNNKNTARYFVEETNYYLMMAYIKTGDIKSAKEKMNIILTDKNHLYYNNVKKISSLQFKVLDLKNKK
jgi:tetratricopeptide (TPR) repeat protein